MDLLSQKLLAKGTLYHSYLKTLRLAAWNLSGRPSRVLAFQRMLLAQHSCAPDQHRIVYDGRWCAFVGWCDEQGFNPIHATVGQDFDFLQEYSKLVQLNTVLGYVTAISNRHALVDGQALSADKTVRKCVSSLKLTNDVPRSLVPVWNLDLVLAALKRQPFEPITSASLKHLTWNTVFLSAIMSMHSASELHALCYKELYLSMPVAEVVYCEL